ncbi:hypothetical protein SAMN05216525_12925 [Bradyrhizobium sp. Gha]|nr:hypothetical protein SAMN05216525_12925 [Bradyrhizobium sp. Gha]
MGVIRALPKISEPPKPQRMSGALRNTPKIIFRMDSVQTIDKFIARSFDMFHCATSVTSRVSQRE